MAPSGLDSATLRALVREVLREAVPELVTARGHESVGEVLTPAAGGLLGHRDATDNSSMRTPPDATDTGHTRGDDAELVRLDTDRDLDAFVRRLAKLFDNPRIRAEVRSGKRRFALAPGASRPASSTARRRIDKGAVTEAHVKDAARAGAGLVLGRRAVLTPLARDRARALGVVIEKEA